MSEMEEPGANESFNPAGRRLCPDGSCVGLVGDDGRCRVCGRTEAQAAAGEAAPATVEAVEGPSVSPTPGAAVSFDPKRRLCDDGSCVGVVGDDGVCRVCGRRSE